MRRVIRPVLVPLVAMQLLIAGVSPALAFQNPPPDRATQARNAVLAGRDYLLSQQNTTSGCWSTGNGIVGVSALAVLATVHSEQGGYAGLSAAVKAAIDKGTKCLTDHVQTDGTIHDCSYCGHDTYSTSIAIWALSDVPVTATVTAAITGGRTWLLDNQRNSNDPAGRADQGGNQNNGGWYYEGGKAATFVEHSNSSFALQGLEASGGVPVATANLAQGYFSCLQRRGAQLCGSGGGSKDGGFIYSQELNKGGSQTSATGSGSFALSVTGVAPTDGRITDALAFLDASLTYNACDNNNHGSTDLSKDWSATGSLTHYGMWATLKAHELAGVVDDVNKDSNWFFKIANCLTNEQQKEGTAKGRIPASGREDDILATSFGLLTLEKVTPEKQIAATGKTITATEGTDFSGAVATITDADTNATASEYTATIDWGDDSTSVGTVSGDKGGPFTVSGSHTYADEKAYTITVTITDVDNATNGALATSTANVADAAVSSQCAMPVNRSTAYSGPVASFTDASPAGTLSDFSAAVNWGDGSTSAGTIAGGPGTSPYTVSASHTYSATGAFTVTTTITDSGGASTTATCPAVVQLAATGGRGPVDRGAAGMMLLAGLGLLGLGCLGLAWRRRKA